MPTVKIDDTLRMHYEIDNFVEPWVTPEVVLLVHGMTESTVVWYASVPRLARKYPVVRIALRGFIDLEAVFTGITGSDTIFQPTFRTIPTVCSVPVVKLSSLP